MVLLVDGERRELPYSEVAHAGVQVEFRPPPEAEVHLLASPRETSAEESG